MKHVSKYVWVWHKYGPCLIDGGLQVDHHWDPTWLHQGECVIQLQPPPQQQHTMCPLWWGRTGDKEKQKKQSLRGWRQEPQSVAQTNTWNQAVNSHDNSRVSGRKQVKQTVCCLIVVFSQLSGLSLRLSVMGRWRELCCSGHFYLVFFNNMKVEGLWKKLREEEDSTWCIKVKHQT